MVQALMRDNHAIVDSWYEPFLWDKNVFNRDFNLVRQAFGQMDSISVEGIYQHQKLPLFIDSPGPFLPNRYLDELFLPGQDDRHLVAKFIRANGRIRLLNAACQGILFVFIIRNPVDSVNSIMGRFSYFGGEFHHDDYPRFLEGIRHRYPVPDPATGDPGDMERELMFWYYMNRYALETFALEHIPVYRICYEDFLARPGRVLQGLTEFLGYPYHEKYLSLAGEKVGTVTAGPELTQGELSLMKPYWERYLGLIRDFDADRVPDLSEITGRYRILPGDEIRSRGYYGVTPPKLVREIDALKREIKALKDEVRRNASKEKGESHG